MNTHIQNKSKQELIESFDGTPHNITMIEQQKMAIFSKALEELQSHIDNLTSSLVDLKDSMRVNAESSDKLANRVFILDFVVGTATIVGIIVAILR